MGDVDNGEGQPQQHDGDQRDYAREDQGRDYAREDQGRDRSRSRSRDREPGPGKERGIALRWNQEKGFGFIKPDSGGDDLFCHFSCVEGGNMLKEGSEVPPPAPSPLLSPPRQHQCTTLTSVAPLYSASTPRSLTSARGRTGRSR